MSYHFSPAISEQITVSGSESQPVFFYCWADSSDIAIEIWAGSDLRPWTAVPFSRVASLDESSNKRSFFSASLPVIKGESYLEFTYRLPHGGDSFTWLGAAGQNGRITFQEPFTAQFSLSGILKDLDPAFVVSTPQQNQNLLSTVGADGDDQATLPTSLGPNKNLNISLLSAELDASVGPGQIKSFHLGRPQYGAKLSVLENATTWWQTTRHLASLSELDMRLDVQLLQFSSNQDDQTIAVVYPLVTEGVYSTLRGDMNKSDSTPIWLRAERGFGKSTKARLLVGWAKESQLAPLIRSLVQVAAEIVTKDNDSQLVSPRTGSLELVPRGIGYCTWNSLNKPYKLSQVIACLEDIEKSGMSTVYDSLLLDDGWQDTSDDGRYQRLLSFGCMPGWADVSPKEGELPAVSRPDSGYSPSPNLSQSGDNESDAESSPVPPPTGPSVDEFARSVQLLKKRFPFLKKVGVWCTLQGYWFTLSPDTLGQHYKLFENTFHDWIDGYNDTGYLPIFSQWKDFWLGYFSTLKHAGVDYVKVDNMANLNRLTEGEEEAKIKSVGHKVMLQAAKEIFGDKIIHCMAQSGRLNASEFGLASGHGEIVRQYDDYFPERDETHRTLISHNSQCALLSKALTYTPDFDMFQTAHPYASYHASFRTFSPAPVYITDDLSKLDMSIIGKLCAKRKDGSNRVLQNRAGTYAAKPTRLPNTVFVNDLAEGEGSAAKVTYAAPQVGGAVLGLWNTRANLAAVFDTVSRKDLANVVANIGSKSAEKKDWFLYSHKQQKALSATSFSAEEELTKHDTATEALTSVVIPAKGWDLFTVVPSLTLANKEGRLHSVACLGLLDKYGAISAIKSVSVASASMKKATDIAPPAPVQSSSKPAPVEKSSPAPAANFAAADSDLEDEPAVRSQPSHSAAHLSTFSFSSEFAKSPIRALALQFRRWASAGLGLFIYLVGFRWLRTRAVEGSAAKSITASADHQEADERTPLLSRAYDEQEVDERISVEEPAEPAAAETEETEDNSSTKLRVEIDFAGKVGFIVQSSHTYTFSVDGENVEAQTVDSGNDFSIVAVDLCQATNTQGDSWLLEVSV